MQDEGDDAAFETEGLIQVDLRDVLDQAERAEERFAMPHPVSARVGTMARLGGRLERLLRRLVFREAEQRGVDPDTFVGQRGQKSPADRATLHQLARVLQHDDDHPPDERIAPLVDDLRAKRRSSIFTLIRLRNQAVHEPDLVEESEQWNRSVRDTLGKVTDLLRRQLRAFTRRS